MIIHNLSILHHQHVIGLVHHGVIVTHDDAGYLQLAVELAQRGDDFILTLGIEPAG